MTDKAYFNIKQTKRSNPEARTTLDNLHQIQINQLQQEKDNSQALQQEIQSLQQQIEECTDIIQKTKLEDMLEEVKKKRDDWRADRPLYDYFFDTGDILFKYYDLQEKIQKGTVQAQPRIMKAKPGSVLAALNKGLEEVPSPQSKSQAPVKEGREELLEQYLQKVDPEHARQSSTTFEDPYGICEKCDKEMTFSANEALFFCECCGEQEFVLIDSDKPSYKDPPREVTYYAYKRINHFNEWLAQFQAKESTEIPEDVFQAILEELRKERITNVDSIKPAKIREILKKLKYTNFYEHVPYILNRINGKTAPVMSREIEEKLRFMFKEIQSSFIKHCPKNRSNFLSYSYVLYKFCQLLELDEYLQCFPLLKNRDKLYNQDKIWQKICEDLRWEFIRSI
jgi:RNA polymerase-binding transcription factor DksA